MQTAIDRAAYLNRWRQRALSEKVLLGLGMLALALILPPVPAAPIVAVLMSAIAILGARVPARTWLAASAVPLGFLLTGAATLMVDIGSNGIGFSPTGAVSAGMLVMRAMAGLSCLLFLALTTPATDLVGGMRRLGLPAEIVDIALLTYRFIFLLAASAASMDAAQQARLGHSTPRRRIRSLGLLTANLLPRALARARRMEQGLAARGWDGEMRVLHNRRAASVPVLAAIIVLMAAVAASSLVA